MHICQFFCFIQSTVAHIKHLTMQQLQCSSIKFCTYNFMLNEAPNNNDVTHIANTMVNEEPNSNDTMCTGNTVCLTAMSTQQFSMVAIQPSCRKGDLPVTRDNDTKTTKVCADGNKLCPGKEWRLHAQQFRLQVDQCGQASRQIVRQFFCDLTTPICQF